MGGYFMVEGLDGSGKTAALSAIRDWAQGKKLRILDAKEMAGSGTFPDVDEIENCDILFTAEPTYSFVGKALRDELILEGNGYDPAALAGAFALDREIHLRRLIIPAREMGKLIVQERGLPSAVAYQPVHEKLALPELMRLPGNALAAKHPPDVLLINTVPAEVALSRINGRFSQRFSVFDNLFMQRLIAERYGSLWMKAMFERLGTKVHHFDADANAIEQNKKNAVRLFSGLAQGSLRSDETQTQL